MKKFKVRLKTTEKDEIVEVNGYNVDDKTFVYNSKKSGYNFWFVVDKATGMNIVHGDTRKETLERYHSEHTQTKYAEAMEERYYKKLVEEFNRLAE